MSDHSSSLHPCESVNNNIKYNQNLIQINTSLEKILIILNLGSNFLKMIVVILGDVFSSRAARITRRVTRFMHQNTGTRTTLKTDDPEPRVFCAKIILAWVAGAKIILIGDV